MCHIFFGVFFDIIFLGELNIGFVVIYDEIIFVNLYVLFMINYGVGLVFSDVRWDCESWSGIFFGLNFGFFYF